MKKIKIYSVNIDMKWSEEYLIKANSASEARKKAWEKFKKNPPKKLFELMVDEN